MAPIIKKRKQPKGYRPVDTDGKLYRVRDKDYGDGSEVKIWGENLTYEAAHALKEKVVGAKKTRTARIEEMSIAMPSADPTLELVRQKGLAAGRVAAATAQGRAIQLAARRRQEANAASAPRPKRGLHVAKPVPMELDPDLETPDVPDEDDLGETDEIGDVQAEAAEDINEYEAKGKELYEAYGLVRGAQRDRQVGIIDGLGERRGAVHSQQLPWAELAPKDRAAFSFEATAEQGPHVDAIRAEAAAKEIPAPDANGAGDATDATTS